MQIKKYRRYRGVFAPKRTDDLRPGCAEKIGTVVEVSTGWYITAEDNETYEGCWAMCTPVGWSAAWIPSCDLDNLEEILPEDTVTEPL